MLNEKFILDHIDEIGELRDFDEVYEFFVANGMQVSVQEIMSLKDSPNLANKLKVNSQVLTMAQLDCVAGGWTQYDTKVTIAAIAVGGGVLLGAFTAGVGAAVVAGILGSVGLGSAIYEKISGENEIKIQKEKNINTAVEYTRMNINCG